MVSTATTTHTFSPVPKRHTEDRVGSATVENPTAALDKGARRKSRSNAGLRGDLRASTTDGAFFSLMVGMGETYLPAFTLAIGSGEVASGLIATVPRLTGALLQLFTPWAVERLRSHRGWVVGCGLLQATSLLVVPAVIFWPGQSTLWLFLISSLYWGAGLASGPAWNTWMEAVVPKAVRTRFFAKRSGICLAGTLIGFALGGMLLQLAFEQHWQLFAFIGLFTAAAFCRFASSWFLSRQSEPDRGGTLRQSSLWLVFRNMRGQAGGRLLLYLLLVQVTVQTAGPFFTPYLLVELKVSYFEFMLLISAALAGKMWAMSMWGNLAKSMGAQRLLRIGGIAIVPLSGLWLISDNFWFLLCLQLLSGVAWSAYELAMLLLFFESIPRHERTSLLTIYNAGNSIALVSGSVLGAAVLKGLGVGSELGQSFPGLSPYLVLFGLSTILRLLTLPLLFRVPDLRFQVVIPSVRVLSLRPADAGDDPPILTGITPGGRSQHRFECAHNS